MELKHYSLTLAIAGHRKLTDKLAEEFFDCGINDASLREMNGRLFLDLHRADTDFNEVMHSIVRQLERLFLSIGCIFVDESMDGGIQPFKPYTFDINIPSDLSKLDIMDLYDYFHSLTQVEDILILDGMRGSTIHVTISARSLNRAIKEIVTDLQRCGARVNPHFVYWESRGNDNETIWIPIIN